MMRRWQAPAVDEQTLAEQSAPPASPRLLTEWAYQRDGVGIACATEIMLRGLRDLLEQGGTIEDLWGYVQGLEAAGRGLRTVATGLHALQTSSGVA